MDKLNISVLLPFEEDGRARLKAAAPISTISYADNPAEADIDALLSADIVIGNPPPRLLPEMRRLKWIQLRMAGTEPYSKPGVLREGIVLTNVTGAFGHAISEHMVGCVFSLFKKLHLYRDQQSERIWQSCGTVRSIDGAVTVVVGLGDIGGQFAQRMKALGAYTIGVRRADLTKPDYADEIHLSENLDELLPRADIVALALPNTPATQGLMNASRISRMKKDAILLNVGRGNAVDADALCDAVESGALGGAALDVTDPEPLPPEHRMWGVENIIITPHVSGFFHLRQTYDNVIDICVENVRRFTAGEKLMNIVDFTTGYSMKN